MPITVGEICSPALFGSPPGGGGCSGARAIANGTPQAWQNFAAAGFSALQAAHFMDPPVWAPMMPRRIRQSKEERDLEGGDARGESNYRAPGRGRRPASLAQQPNGG